MKHELKKLKNSAAEISMTFTAEEVKPKKEEIIAKIAKDAEVPGFRKGHVPAKTIEAQYSEAIAHELAEALINENYETVVREENVRPVSYITDLHTDDKDGFTVTFKTDIYPEVKLGDYKGIEVEKETFEMTPEKLDNELKLMLNTKVRLEDTADDHKAEMGDTLDLAFEGFVDGVAFEGGKADSHMLELGTHTFIDNFEDQLVGYTKGQEGEVKVNFPAEYGVAELAGKPAVFKVKVNAIKKSVTPELNDELAKEFDAENVEDLKEKTTKRIVEREEAKIKNDYIAKLLEKLAETTEVEIPVSMITNEVENRIAQMEQQFASQGIKLDMYLQMTGTKLEDLKVQIAPMAAAQVKSNLMLAEIVKKEGLKVTEEELNEKIEEVAKMYGMDMAALKEQLDKMGNYDAFVASVEEETLMQKAIDLLIANAK